MPAYEISNHADPGHEVSAQPYLLALGDYAGIGPGAQAGSRWPRPRAPDASACPNAGLPVSSQQGHGELPREAMRPTQQLTELLMMGLRLREGVPLARIEAAAGRRSVRRSRDAPAASRSAALCKPQPAISSPPRKAGSGWIRSSWGSSHRGPKIWARATRCPRHPRCCRRMSADPAASVRPRHTDRSSRGISTARLPRGRQSAPSPPALDRESRAGPHRHLLLRFRLALLGRIRWCC